MTPYQLKRSILTQAVQGVLVEQIVSEGTAKELLLINNKEKSAIMKAEKVKAAREPKPIDDHTEFYYEIPENWEWERFGNLVINYDSRRKPVAKELRKTEQGTYDYYGATGAIDKVDEYIFEGEYLMIGEDGGNFFVDRDNSFIANGQFWANNHVHVVRPAVCDIRYLKHFLDSLNLPRLGLINGIAVPKLNQENLNSILVPVPPLEEQHRIVAKIEELLPYVDRYASSYEKLEQFNAKFPEDMKKSILQYAMQGNLVEPRAEEGNAEDLYQQIQKEKQRMIKEGKIKKEKPLAEITEDEIPFDIPESWKWVRVGDLFNHNTGKAMNASAKKVVKAGAIRKFITTSNVYWNTLDLTTVKEMFFSDDELERCTITKGDMLMCEGGAYFGRTAIWNFDYDICFQNHVHRLRPYISLNLLFFYYVFYFYRNTGLMQSKGTAMPGLSSIALHNMVVPLPPLEEQHRIVAKIEELLPYCNQLIK